MNPKVLGVLAIFGVIAFLLFGGVGSCTSPFAKREPVKSQHQTEMEVMQAQIDALLKKQTEEPKAPSNVLPDNAYSLDVSTGKQFRDENPEALEWVSLPRCPLAGAMWPVKPGTSIIRGGKRGVNYDPSSARAYFQGHLIPDSGNYDMYQIKSMAEMPQADNISDYWAGMKAANAEVWCAIPKR